MESNNLDIVQHEINSPSDPYKKSKSFPKILIGIIIGIIGTIILTGVALGVYYYSQINKTELVQNQSANISPTTTVNNLIPSNTVGNLDYSQYGSLTWLNNPQPIASLNIFKESITDPNGGDYDYNNSKYYLIGNFSDGAQLINVDVSFQGPGGDMLIKLIKNGTNISVLKNMTIGNYSEDYSNELSSNINLSDINITDGLTVPDAISINGISLKKVYEGSDMFSSLKDPQKIFDSEFGPVYQVNTPAPNYPDVFTKKFYLKLKDNHLAIYWLVNKVQSAGFNQNIVANCSIGGAGTPFIKKDSSLLTNKVDIGIDSNTNQSVYQIMDSNNSFVQEIYKNYITGDNTNTTSIGDFANKENHFLWQDSQGDWQIFISDQYSPAAECGKPVIYLYPQKETQVKVQVGAQITKSEPIYPQGGWLVNAKPNGELTYQNQTYPYLFWEGLGNGIYPDYQNRGTVVTQKDLIPTINKQLSQLGLNTKESADFMAFWQPKLPTTPYVRLTWLNTNDMDKLAPLTVNPKPNTKIRIFLEFAGLNKPVNLIPQILDAPKRLGFTLVEWGGLLIGKQ